MTSTAPSTKFNDHRAHRFQYLSGVASIPDVDFDPLAAALDAIQDSDGNWWWPCEATITFMPKGTQNREYTFNIADPTVPFDGQAGYCGSRVGNAIGGGVWYVIQVVARCPF